MIAWLTKGSWKTTSAGLLAILGGLVRLAFALKAGALTEEAVMTTLTTIVTGLGLLVARDNDKSSESVGADEGTKIAKQFAKSEPKPPAPPAALLLLCAGLAAMAAGPVLVMGCKASQQRAAYNTLATVQTVTVGAYDGYVSEIIAGRIKTNDLPRVSRQFNVFQAAFLVALDAVEYNTNALAPANLTTLSTDLLNLINTATKANK